MRRSTKSQLQQKTLSLFDEADLPERRVHPKGTAGGLRDFAAQDEAVIRKSTVVDLMEEVVAHDNMRAALRRVEQNKGAAGVDRMPVKQLRPYLKTHWPKLKQALLTGTYKPKPVRRVEIPKPGGGVRLLGIPTVVDRLIQQALLQVLTPLFDPHFSDASFGFRPERRGHDAVRRARQFVRDGWDWVVDLDLEKFFDKVNHDILMSRIARKVTDKLVLGLIRRFLTSGIMLNGIAVASEEGTPQGGPLSPLLANILLDDLDKELEARGHRHVRYADDCNIYVRSRRAGERVRQTVTNYLKHRLKLTVNESKSAVDRPWKRKFLGFSLLPQRDKRIRLASQTKAKAKEKIRNLTQRSAAVSMTDRIEELNQYLGGWMGYFALAETPSVFKELDKWLRRRLRMCQWKQWKQGRTRKRELRALGLKEELVRQAASSNRYWRIAHSQPLHVALGNAYWQAQGLVSLADRYQRIRQAW